MIPAFPEQPCLEPLRTKSWCSPTHYTRKKTSYPNICCVSYWHKAWPFAISLLVAKQPLGLDGIRGYEEKRKTKSPFSTSFLPTITPAFSRKARVVSKVSYLDVDKNEIHFVGGNPRQNFLQSRKNHKLLWSNLYINCGQHNTGPPV